VLKNPVIILVSPQLGENIGACARAMKNFGLNVLRIVSPRDGWPNKKACSAAVGAVDLIESAQIYDNLKDAVADLEFIYATTCIARTMNKEYVLSKELHRNFNYKIKTGILFGRENCGLTNKEITFANKIITIETDPNFASLNIAQAVLVVCYEIFKSVTRPDLSNIQDLATKEEIGFFYDHLLNMLDNANFFKIYEKKEAMQRNILNIFSRIDKLSKSEVQTLRGIIKALEPKVDNKPL